MCFIGTHKLFLPAVLIDFAHIEMNLYATRTKLKANHKPGGDSKSKTIQLDGLYSAPDNGGLGESQLTNNMPMKVDKFGFPTANSPGGTCTRGAKIQLKLMKLFLQPVS